MYKVGDVVFCRFPYREDPTQFTNRPALVMKVLNQGTYYMLAQITSTDRRNSQLIGYWVEQKSKENFSMNLKTDSFINLSNILKAPSHSLVRLLGKCPIMPALEKLCKDSNIKY